MTDGETLATEILDGRLNAHRHAAYDHLRALVGPVRGRTPYGGVTWVVTRYDQARAVLADPRVSKVEPASAVLADPQADETFDAANNPFADNMLSHDQPEHGRLRRAVQPAFSPRRIAALAPRIQEICDDLIDGFADRGEAELIADFAFQLPMRVICELLGIASSTHDEIMTIMQVFFVEDTNQDVAELNQDAAPRLMDFVDRLIATKQSDPGTDLVTDLVQAEEPLTHREMASTIMLLIVAGFLTTVNLIGNAMFALLQDEKALLSLREDPERIPLAIEEFLRYESPFAPAVVYASEDMEVGGVKVAKDESFTVMIDAANRDPERYPDAETLVLDRAPRVAPGFRPRHSPLRRSTTGPAGRRHRSAYVATPAA
ncbi:cytochrome P450 [Fodinicola feengrottensis]|uniref:cytochrome P450 n=1 Tax=Fodinicola feengrottensis TaxID=435914 RepID=UPI0013D11824|nr:cytochrome P450 [Fodinicola feengrottensis]